MAETEQSVLPTPALLASKTAEAHHQYALKNYVAAAELYSEATSLQAELNGEMALENADLLYAYGRCLYHVGVSKSEVLGGKVAGEKERQDDAGNKRGKKRKKTEAGGEDDHATAEAQASSTVLDPNEGDEQLAAARVEQAVEQKKLSAPKTNDRKPATRKAFLQIEGDDAAWTDSEEDDEGEGIDEDNEVEEEEEDDFAIAYEVLDVARILLQRRLDEGDNVGADTLPSSDVLSLDKSKAKGADILNTQTRERLADTHDLQGEIQLEGERFGAALPDFRLALQLKQRLYPAHSSLIAEAHYKVSLALEFASVTSNKEAGDEGPSEGSEEQKTVDEDMRAEAATHMEAAIASSRSRIDIETSKLADSSSVTVEERSKLQKEVNNVKDMVADMEQRLQDLRAPLVTLNSNPDNPANATVAATTDAGADPLRGVLGSVLGESVGERNERINAAKKDARDLTGLVRSKKRKSPGDEHGNGDSDGDKKAKLENA